MADEIVASEKVVRELREKIAGYAADLSKAQVTIVGLEEELRRANMTIGDERGYVQTERRIALQALEENRQLKAENAALKGDPDAKKFPAMAVDEWAKAHKGGAK